MSHQKPAPSTQSNLAGKRILLLTDADYLSRIAEQTISKMGGLIEIISRPSAAINRLTNNHYDIILLADHLIDKTINNWLQQNTRQQRVILLSHSLEANQLTDWFHLGISDLLSPSLSSEALYQSLVRVLPPIAQKTTLPSRKIIRDCHPYYGEAPSISILLNQIEKIAPTTSPVLLEGETGTGKSFFARRIHELSKRKGRLVSINCATFSTNLLESELFGHAKGAFTGAEAARPGLAATAANGTLFLDEIGELPPELQPKLLHLLEDQMIRPVGSDIEQPITARIVAATNCDLKQRVKEGKFRADLYYRLNVIPLKIPSLRSRSTDIPSLANNFIDELCKEHNLPKPIISKTAMKALKNNPWLGNIRELRNHLERALLLNMAIEQGLLDNENEQPETVKKTGWLKLDEHEKEHILHALNNRSGNKSQAALLLGISRRTLERKLKRWGDEAT